MYDIRGCLIIDTPAICSVDTLFKVLMFNVPVNSYSHVRTVSEDIMVYSDNMSLVAKHSNGPRSAVGSESDCRSSGRKFDPSPVPYFRGD